MKYKDLKGYLIAIDLDGTLVQNFDDIDKETFETLKQVAKQNYVVIATGRPFRSSKYFYDLLELNTPIINYNGALLHNPKDSNFPKKMITIDKSKLLKFIDCNKAILDNLFCEIEDDIYLYKDEKGIEPYLHLNGGDLHTGDFETILPSDPNGAILFVKLNCEKQLEDYYYITNKKGLISEAQMNSIEFHTWGSRVESLETPDIMVFDLDPDEKLSIKKLRDGVKDLKIMIVQKRLYN